MPSLRPKHPRAIRWAHWINFPLLMLMLWSGLLIYWANDVYRLGWGQTTVFHLFPEGFYRERTTCWPRVLHGTFFWRWHLR
jgi:hypothetical protein